MFVPGKPFQTSLKFVGKDRSLPWVKTPVLSFGLTHKHWKRLKDLQGRNTLAYCENYGRKKFHNIEPWSDIFYLAHLNKNILGLVEMSWSKAIAQLVEQSTNDPKFKGLIPATASYG